MTRVTVPTHTEVPQIFEKIVIDLIHTLCCNAWIFDWIFLDLPFRERFLFFARQSFLGGYWVQFSRNTTIQMFNFTYKCLPTYLFVG